MKNQYKFRRILSPKKYHFSGILEIEVEMTLSYGRLYYSISK
jgi:hypothetical protein